MPDRKKNDQIHWTPDSSWENHKQKSLIITLILVDVSKFSCSPKKVDQPKRISTEFPRVFPCLMGNLRGPPRTNATTPVEIRPWWLIIRLFLGGSCGNWGGFPLDSNECQHGQVSILLKPSIGFIHSCSLKGCSLKKSWVAMRLKWSTLHMWATKKTLPYFPLYWLVNRDPYVMVY